MRLGPAEIAILALVAILLLGWKKMPDMARSLGRSMRVFKSEVNEMKRDGQGAPTSVQGEVVPPPAPAAPPSVTPGAATPDLTQRHQMMEMRMDMMQNMMEMMMQRMPPSPAKPGAQ